MPKKIEKHAITAGDFKVTSKLFNYLQNVKARPSISANSQRNFLNIGNREKNLFKMASGVKRARGNNRKKLPSSPKILLKPKSSINNLKNRSTRMAYSRKARSTKSSKMINSLRINSDQCTSTQAVTFYTSTPLNSVQIACLQNKRLLNTASGIKEMLGSAGSDGIQKSIADSASIAKTGQGTKYNVTSIKFTGSKVKGRKPSEKPKESVIKINRSGKPSLTTMKSDVKTYMGRKSSGKLMNSKVITFTDRSFNVVRLKPIKKLSFPYSDPLPGTSSADIKDRAPVKMLLTDTTQIVEETKDIIKGGTFDNLGKADKRRRNAKILFRVPPIKSKKITRNTVKKQIKKSLPDQSKTSPSCVKKNTIAPSKSRKNNKIVKVTSQLEIPVMVPIRNARKPSKISSSKKLKPSVDLTVKKELNLSPAKNKKSPSLKETKRTSKEFLPLMTRVTPKRISKTKSTNSLSLSHRVKKSKSSSKAISKNIEKTVLNIIEKPYKRGSKTKHRAVYALPNKKQRKIQSPKIKTCKESLSKKNRIMSYSLKGTRRSVTKTRNKKTDVLKYKAAVAAFQDNPVIKSAKVQNHSSQIIPTKKSYGENKVYLQKNALKSSTATGNIKTDVSVNKTAVVAVVDILDTLPKMMKSKFGKLQPKTANLSISSLPNKDFRKSEKRKIKLSNAVKGFPKQPSPTKKRQHATSKSSVDKVPKRLETGKQKSLSFATKRTLLKAVGKTCRNLPSVVKINPQILQSVDHLSSKFKNEDALAVSYKKSSMKKRSKVQNESLELSTKKQKAQKRVKNQVKRLIPTKKQRLLTIHKNEFLSETKRYKNLNNNSQSAAITGQNKSQTVAKKPVNQSFRTSAGHKQTMSANRSAQSRKLKSYSHSSKIGQRLGVVRKVRKSTSMSIKQASPIQKKKLPVHIRSSLKKLSVPKSPLQSMTSSLYQTKSVPDGRISFKKKTIKARTHAKTGSHVLPGMGRNANQVKKEIRKSLIDKKLKPSFSSQRSTLKPPLAKQLRKRGGTDKSSSLLKNDIHISKLKSKTLHKLSLPSPRKKPSMSRSLPSVKNYPQAVNVTSEPLAVKIKTKSSSGPHITRKESLQIKRKKSPRKTTKVPITRSPQKSKLSMTIEPKIMPRRKQPARNKKHLKKLDAVNTKKYLHAINIGMASHTFADTINTSHNLSQKLKYKSFGGQQRLSSFRQGKKESKSTSQGKKSKGPVRRGTSKLPDSKKPNGKRARINVNDSRHNVRPVQATSLKKYTTGSPKHTTYQKKGSLVSSRKVKALSTSKLMETNSYTPPTGKKVIKSISSLLTEANKNYIKDRNAEKRPRQGKSVATDLTTEERLLYRNHPLLSAKIEARNSLTPIAERFQGAAKTETNHAILGQIETLVPLFGGSAVTEKKSYMSSEEVKRKYPLSAQKQSAVGKNTEKSDFAYHKSGNVRGLSKTLSFVAPVLVKYDNDAMLKVETTLQPQKKTTTSRVVSIDKTTKSVQKPLYDRKVTDDSPVITRNEVIHRRSGGQTSSPFHITETYFLKKSVLGPDTTIRVQDNIETDQPVLLSRYSLSTDQRNTRPPLISASRSLDIRNHDASGTEEKQEVKETSYACEESEESGFEEDKSDKGELKINENTILNRSKHSQQCTVS